MASDFLDFRTAPRPSGGFIGAHDFSGVVCGIPDAMMFFYSMDEDPGIVTARRTLDGVLEVTARPERFEPVMDGESLIGLRFPGSDRYPWQPWGATMSEPCRVYWGSHGCSEPRGHLDEVPHVCDCCDCEDHPDEDAGCVARPPYYGEGTLYYGEDAEALGLPLVSTGLRPRRVE